MTGSSNVLARESTAAVTNSRAGKYLTFFLSEEEYGLAILSVSEIIGMQSITRVPRMPAFVRGVINLRGKVIPITDLRSKLNMPDASRDESCIVVVQLQGVQTGLVVDRVSEVVAIAESDVSDSPSFGAGIHTEFLLGIATQGERVRLLLDIDRVLARAEVDALQTFDAMAA